MSFTVPVCVSFLFCANALSNFYISCILPAQTHVNGKQEWYGYPRVTLTFNRYLAPQRTLPPTFLRQTNTTADHTFTPSLATNQFIAHNTFRTTKAVEIPTKDPAKIPTPPARRDARLSQQTPRAMAGEGTKMTTTAGVKRKMEAEGVEQDVPNYKKIRTVAVNYRVEAYELSMDLIGWITCFNQHTHPHTALDDGLMCILAGVKVMFEQFKQLPIRAAEVDNYTRVMEDKYKILAGEKEEVQAGEEEEVQVGEEEEAEAAEEEEADGTSDEESETSAADFQDAE